MTWEIPFVRKREPEFNMPSPPVTREYGEEPVEGFPHFPDPVRSGLTDGIGHRRAQLFSTFASWDGFGKDMGAETFSGRAYQPDPAAAYPEGEFSKVPPRKVIARPSTRTTR